MDKIEKDKLFEKELTALLNRFDKESESNTPDFILAEYLIMCLDNYTQTKIKNEKWHN